jgi:hypothetical protein
LKTNTREKNISLTLKNITEVEGLLFHNSHFDAIYSNIFYNMSFNDNELKFLFNESNRVLRQVFYYFSVRSNHDIMYRKGSKIAENLYDINGFQIRFFRSLLYRK